MRNFRYAVLNEDNKTYAPPATLGGAIECKVSLDIAEAELYSDDRLKEKASVFKKGSITLGIDDDDDSVFAELLGQKISVYKPASDPTGEGIKEYISTTEDIQKYCGFGQVVPKLVKGSRQYKVEWFPKVQFKPFSVDKKTKGDGLEFTTPSVEGSIFENSDKEWRHHAIFETEALANEYLDSLFIQPPSTPTNTLKSNTKKGEPINE